MILHDTCKVIYFLYVSDQGQDHQRKDDIPGQGQRHLHWPLTRRQEYGSRWWDQSQKKITNTDPGQGHETDTRDGQGHMTEIDLSPEIGTGLYIVNNVFILQYLQLCICCPYNQFRNMQHPE